MGEVIFSRLCRVRTFLDILIVTLRRADNRAREQLALFRYIGWVLFHLPTSVSDNFKYLRTLWRIKQEFKVALRKQNFKLFSVDNFEMLTLIHPVARKSAPLENRINHDILIKAIFPRILSIAILYFSLPKRSCSIGTNLTSDRHGTEQWTTIENVE